VAQNTLGNLTSTHPYVTAQTRWLAPGDIGELFLQISRQLRRILAEDDEVLNRASQRT
jgi:hypothetical protein